MSHSISRREIALGALAAAGLSGQSANPPGVGVIGLGNRSKAHFSAYTKLPEVHVVALSDLESARIDAVNAKLPAKAAAYTDYHELLKDKNVGIVVIATPNFSHHDIAIAALRAGKDVLLEKPIAINYKEACEIRDEAKKSGRILAIGMQRIFRSDRDLVELIHSGTIGNVKLITCGEFRRDWFPGGWVYTDPVTHKSGNWRFMHKAIGSSELEFSVHLFGTLASIIGSPLKTIWATGGDLHYPNREIRDASTTSVEFANGVRLGYSYCMFAPQAPFLVILGENGSIRRDGGKISVFDSGGKAKAVPAPQPAGEPDEVLLYRDFLEAVKTRRQPRVGPDLAIDAAKIAYGLELSITENRVVTARDFA